MAKQISLKLKKIQYGGDLIGQNIRIETQIQGQAFVLDTTIKHGTTAEPDLQIASFPANAAIFEAQAQIKITEKDFLFSDVGSSSANLRIDTQAAGLAEFNIEIRVREWNRIFRKSTAIFSVKLVARIVDDRKLKPYISPNSKQDYNRFDTEIIYAVAEWNKHFVNQENPPAVLLDPDLVKAMIYIESDMGYYILKGRYPGYPDVMQVADPDNPAIYALKDIVNPKLNKMATEYEVINGVTVPLQYPETSGSSSQTSIFWGVRWLYHQAQENIEEDGNWRRKWIDWKEAIYRYNNGGDKDYVKKVYSAYENGIGRRGFKLWQILLLTLIGAGIIYGVPVHNNSLTMVTGKVAGQTISTSKNAEVFEGSGAAKLAWDNYPPTGCNAKADEWENHLVFENCAYTVGSNWSATWTVQLKDGHYGFTPEGLHNYGDYGYDSVGPYAVWLDNSIEGDLNGDGKNDAVVILNLSSGSIGHWLNMVVLVQERDGQYSQIVNYMFEDREAIRGLSIDNGIITVRVLVRADSDPQCCPSVYDTYRFKITD
jgi:hypothetical protein